MRWLGYLATILWWSGIARSLSSLNRGHSYKISPKPCRIAGPGGGDGTCMFVWECIKSEGTHVGVCVDTFMFGSCCVHNSTTNSINSPQASLPNTQRPSLADALADESTRPTSLSSFGQTRPQIHSGTTLRPVSKGPGTTGPRPGRPPQKRPHAKPNSNQDTNRVQTSISQSVLEGSQPQAANVRNGSQSHSHGNQEGTTEDGDKNSWGNGGRRPSRPQTSTSHHHSTKTRPGISGHHQEQMEGRPTNGGSHQEPLGTDHGSKDKVDNSHNTLVIQLPGKNQGSDQEKNQQGGPKHKLRPHRPGAASGAGQSQKPSVAERPSESRPDDRETEDSDLVVQETINRPSLNSVQEHETAEKPSYPSLNFIHTERPQWATKPAASHKPSTGYSKPYFSQKTTTYRPSSISDHSDTRPNFVSKPDTGKGPTKTSTTLKPTYYSSQSASAGGSGPQIPHWQVTTEPAFVTRQKPSSQRPPTIMETTRPFGTSSHFWSENSWTPPRPSMKPHWTDNPAWMESSPEKSSHRPSFKPTESAEQHTEYQKPLGSAHYITTSYIETSTKPRPTKRTTTTPGTTTKRMTTARPATTTTTPVTTTTRTTTVKHPEVETSTKAAHTGSIMTVSAAAESKNTQCGVPPLFPRPETRIVGGKDAPFGRWPWQVSVRRTSFFGFSSTHRCGGAVLNENWIATAGHCVDDLLTSQIRIRVGEYDFSSVQERLPFVERGVAKKVVHPKYNFFTYEYDLALVRLESPLTFAPHISPICLPATDDLLIGENATVTGWGRLSEGGTLPSVLQEVSVPIVSNDRCKSMFLRAGRHEFIPDIFLCAGHETGGQDSCQGDSGGPLQVRGKDGRYFLAGIISWGIGCAEANLPGVCTRISKFVPWILKNVT